MYYIIITILYVQNDNIYVTKEVFMLSNVLVVIFIYKIFIYKS